MTTIRGRSGAVHHVGELAEVLDNLGVFGMMPTDVIAPCPSGFRRVPIHEGEDSYLSLQGFAPNQVAYAHTHPDSEEWVVVIGGSGEALLSEQPVGMSQGQIIGLPERRRALAHPVDPASEAHGSGDHVGRARPDDRSDRLRGRGHMSPVRAVRGP